MIKSKYGNTKSKLQSCLPGSIVKYEDGPFAYVLGAAETPGKLLLQFPSGTKSEVDKTTVVTCLLGPDEARLTLLRIMGLIEEI